MKFVYQDIFNTKFSEIYDNNSVIKSENLNL